MSKSNEKYIASVAFAQGLSQVMATHYNKLQGREKFKNMILDLYNTCDKIIVSHKEKLTHKEEAKIHKAVSVMKEHGLENASSYKTYISFLIALISERITELSRSKRVSQKQAKLEGVLEKLTPMYEYFEQRIKANVYDEDALKLLNNFNLLFN